MRKKVRCRRCKEKVKEHTMLFGYCKKCSKKIEERKIIEQNDKLWREIGKIYKKYLKPAKKELGLPTKPGYPFLFKGRFADLI